MYLCHEVVRDAADNESLGVAQRWPFLLPLGTRSIHVQSKLRNYLLRDSRAHYFVIEAVNS